MYCRYFINDIVENYSGIVYDYETNTDDLSSLVNINVL